MLVIVCFLLLLLEVGGRSESSPSGGEIKIIGPPGLIDNYKSSNGKINALPALFGNPVYNGHFVGVLKSSNEHMDACARLPENYFQSDPLDESTKAIALVERGSCTFVEKVKNCQRAGAKGVVVYDNRSYGLLPLMSDDGSGDLVTIPSIIILNKDGLVLKSHVDDDSAGDVEIEISWGLPRRDGRVEWEFWTSSEMSSREKSFVMDFKEAVQSLEDKHLFTPHYLINVGMMEASMDDCSNDRKYCLFSVNGVPGKQLLGETLTQKCVWRVGQNMNDTLLWWDYVEEFNHLCAGDVSKWDGTCSTSVFDKLSMTIPRGNIVESVRKCVFDSGGLDGQGNTVFDEEIKAFTKYDIRWTPAVTINMEIYNGNMLCPNPVDVTTCSVFAAICAAFAPETTPQVCLEHREIGCPRGEKRDTCGVCGGDGSTCSSSQSRSILLGFVLIIILIVAIATVVGLYFKRRFAMADEQFSALRARYQPLEGADNESEMQSESHP